MSDIIKSCVRSVVRALLLLFSVLMAGPLYADNSATSTPISAQQGEAILKELRDIRQLLEQQLRSGSVIQKQNSPSPKTVEVSIENRPFLGNEDAPLILVEFSDYQCPFCRRFHQNTFPQLKAQYIDTGKIRYIAMDLPLAFHAHANLAANAAHCARDQGRFWELRRVLLENANNLSPGKIEQFAQELNLDLDLLQSCISEGSHQPLIDSDMSVARQAGLTGTPSFVLAVNTGDNKARGQKLLGAKPYTYFNSLIDAELSKKHQTRIDKSINSKNYRLRSKVLEDGVQ